MFRKTGKMQKIPVPLQRTVLVHVCASTGDPELCQTLSRGKSETTTKDQVGAQCGQGECRALNKVLHTSSTSRHADCSVTASHSNCEQLGEEIRAVAEVSK